MLYILRTWVEAKFTSSDRGAALVEYGLVVILIAIVAMAAVGLFGGKVSAKFSAVSDSVV